ncbi:hypothetical protein ACYATP_00145 [Lactobacillaceae bacterium Melli_B4]
MKLKKMSTIIITTLAVVTLSAVSSSANDLKWHDGIPKFLINTSWKTKSAKLNYSENGVHYSSNSIVHQAIFGKNDFKTITTGKLRVSWNGMKKDTSVGKKAVPYTQIKYYEKGKNVYVISYVQDNDQHAEENYIYKVSNKKFMMPSKNKMSQSYAKNLVFYKQN